MSTLVMSSHPESQRRPATAGFALRSNRARPPLRPSRRTPLAAFFGSLFALAVPAAAIANTWIVNSCDEDAHSTAPGPNTGTLRWAIQQSNANANPATDIIDMTGLTGANACTGSKITLTTGQLTITHADVTIDGPGSTVLSIDASGLDPTHGRVFFHEPGSAPVRKLTIQNLGITAGHVDGEYPIAAGGCVFSDGDIVLTNSRVSDCHVEANDIGYTALGGGVYAAGSITLDHSIVSGNDADTSYNPIGIAEGGGVFARNDVTLTSFSSIEGNSADALYYPAFGGGAYAGSTLSLTTSTLSGNTASGAIAAGGGGWAGSSVSVQYGTVDHNSALSSYFAEGGGIESQGNAELTSSTVSNNSASGIAGGLVAGILDYANDTVTLKNTTISGNSAAAAGGVLATAATVHVYNSTIAFNTATSATYATRPYAPGLAVYATGPSESVVLQSSILSSNVYGSTELDFSVANASPSISGSNSLIVVPAAGTSVPVDTIESTCPLLGPLSDNGGLTMTHQLLSGSPAIDAGNSLVVSDFDQRGSAATNGVQDYPRISGPSADIGAYEVQQSNAIFSAAFDTCPASP